MSQAIDLRQALDPEYSCVVTACAGSGKTWLLTARILRALLAGAHPDEILAITFTRKAIGEIEERIRARLEAFAEADDDELARLLDEIGAPADKATRLRARRIQREFLLSEKGMSVYTFHSWFLRLLRSAPWLPEPGAAIPRKITEADRLHLKEAWRLLLDSADPDSPVGRNLLDLVAMTDQQLDTVKELLTRFVDRRELWLRFGMGCGKESDPLEKAGEALGKFLQAGPDDDPARSLFGSEEFWERIDRIRAHVGALAKPKAKSKVDRFLDGRLAPQQRGDCAQCLEALEKALLTKEGAPLKILLKGPDLEPVVDDVKAAQKRLADMLDHERRIAVLRFNRLALSVADAWLRQYNAVKEAHDENDFTYVEIAACTLLSGDGGSGGNADAIRYKMGQTYRHILVDEFQDTNALQWEALRAWLDSALDSGAVPKVFIVGDPKQSVYRFRGGNPALLGEAGSYLKDKYGAPRPFSQNVTRRCAPRLLDVVNGTFIRTLEGFKKHEAFKDNARLPGRVELAAVSAPKDSPKADGQDKTPLPLRNPLTTPPSSGDGNGTDKAEAEAQMLAERLRAAKEEWAVALPGEKVRPCEWGDFMVLFVQRTNLHALERALRTADIPCVSDSGSGLQSLECGDILALMQVLANPTSNLHLLQVLRSPLFGVASEDLAVVADRGAGGAWRKLQRAAELSPRMRRARDLLREWRGLYRSQPMPAHDFMSEICRRAEVFERYELAVPKGIRHRVRTNLRMLLHLSLREGMARHPHLPRLLREYRRTAAADGGGIREDPPLGNEVALLTIHKAKGLERPFVFVYNAHRSFKRSKGSVQSWILTDVPRDGGAPLPAFCPSKAQGRPKALDALAEEEEGKGAGRVAQQALRRAHARAAGNRRQRRRGSRNRLLVQHGREGRP